MIGNANGAPVPMGVRGAALQAALDRQHAHQLAALKQQIHVLEVILGLGIARGGADRGAWAVDELEAFDAAHVVSIGAGQIQPPTPEGGEKPPALNALVVRVEKRPPPEDRPRLRVVPG